MAYRKDIFNQYLSDDNDEQSDTSNEVLQGH